MFIIIIILMAIPAVLHSAVKEKTIKFLPKFIVEIIKIMTLIYADQHRWLQFTWTWRWRWKELFITVASRGSNHFGHCVVWKGKHREERTHLCWVHQMKAFPMRNQVTTDLVYEAHLSIKHIWHEQKWTKPMKEARKTRRQESKAVANSNERKYVNLQ